MSTCKALTAVSLVWLSTLTTPVAAQTSEQQVDHCLNGIGQFTPAESIAACTGLLQSGRFDNQQLSILQIARGNAYYAQRDYAHAIIEHSEAIRLDSLIARPDAL